jgi:hypothetical protein
MPTNGCTAPTVPKPLSPISQKHSGEFGVQRLAAALIGCGAQQHIGFKRIPSRYFDSLSQISGKAKRQRAAAPLKN